MPNISLAQRPKDGIANRVHQDVGVRMPVESLVVRDLHAAEKQLSALDQLMHIVTDTDMIHVGEYKWQCRTTKEFRTDAAVRSVTRTKSFCEGASCGHHPLHMSKPSTKPLGWLVGLGVLLITLGVIVGLIGIYTVAKRKQKYRIEEEKPIPVTNELPARPASAGVDL